MAKLSVKDRKKVAKAEATGGGFKPITAGKYVAELSQVEVKVSANGNPMWVAEFTDIHDLDGEQVPGRQWYNLNLPTTDTPPDGYKPARGGDPKEKWAQYQELCAGRIKQFFEVFGFTEDSDTDEMIGERAVLQIGIRTIQNGPKTGEQTNTVNGLQPLDSVTFAGSDDSDDEDNF